LSKRLRVCLKRLTPTQLEILKCIQRDMRICEIAEHLKMDEALVVYHRDRAFRFIKREFATLVSKMKEGGS
jgi:FixJ family two-component response regulator